MKQEETTQEVQGLGTGSKRMSTANSALTASPQVKVFLDEVVETDSKKWDSNLARAPQLAVRLAHGG